ncbi:MFS transporter [Microbacterium sp.]|uniref:MFS transporter n=1 Tax=Microbacterium sp. TaxID=51671 RepID=UPI0035B35EBF
MSRAHRPLYLAGFTTAFGAHGVAAALGVETESTGLGFLGLGLILAIYDIAEVILKPIFGALSDRVGAKPVIVGGLLVFAAASVLGIFATSAPLLAITRLGQGAAASAFSPASSSAVARLAAPGQLGRHFGKYGSWKGLGYAAGPLLGAGLIMWAGLPALFAALAILATIGAAWTAISLPRLEVLPKQRATLAALARELTARTFLGPVIMLAAATAVLGVAVGFIPYLGTRIGLDPLVSMGAVTVLAIVSAVIQPRIGRLHDTAPARATGLMIAGAGMLVAGLVLMAVLPSAVVLYAAALLFGVGVGLITPLGFAVLAAATAHERMGRTMGSAELGREVGDAGGPILVGVIAAAATLPIALGSMALVTLVAASMSSLLLRTTSASGGAEDR